MIEEAIYRKLDLCKCNYLYSIKLILEEVHGIPTKSRDTINIIFEIEKMKK